MKFNNSVVIASAIILSACTSTKQYSDIGFRPPAGSYKLIVMRPDISVGLLTAGGSVERRDDWTDQARGNILASLKDQQSTRGGAIKVAATREETGADPRSVADLDSLHAVVGNSIRAHKYAGLKLPTKEGRFDWTLGQPAIDFGKTTGFDYALFLHVEDSFASTGRVALQAVAFMGCMVAICIMPAGGQQAAFASLVDLHTGQVVWFNQLQSSVGDVRTAEGANKVVSGLLDNMKPGADPKPGVKVAS